MYYVYTNNVLGPTSPGDVNVTMAKSSKIYVESRDVVLDKKSADEGTVSVSVSGILSAVESELECSGSARHLEELLTGLIKIAGESGSADTVCLKVAIKLIKQITAEFEDPVERGVLSLVPKILSGYLRW